MTHRELKIAVISDLHCCYPKEGIGNITILPSNIMKYPLLRNPIEALKSIISKEKISVDILLCPGDITNKCDQQGLVSGWSFIEDVHRSIQSKHLLCTVGNHDIDFKREKSSIFDDLVRRLCSNYPTPDPVQNQTFWSDRFCLIEDSKFLLFIYNSSFNINDIANSGKPIIDQITLDKIEEKLLSHKDDGRFKIAMSHHHPHKHSNLDYSDDDVIEYGDELLKLLSKYNFELYIHGHKHDPALNYMYSMPVLGAGSFSSLMNVIDLKADNVFHIITLDRGMNGGIIQTWVYGPHSGWYKKNGSYFPSHTGFGYKGDISKLAEECAEWFNSLNKDMVYFADLTKQISAINYLIPSEQFKLNKIMKEKYKIEFIPELTDLPKVISKQIS